MDDFYFSLSEICLIKLRMSFTMSIFLYFIAYKLLTLSVLSFISLYVPELDNRFAFNIFSLRKGIRKK